ncbi:ZBED6 C-terminal-like protein [Ochotona curzoniae]|uniref:ZBED6 C-terminal-like protein n=1 Tax=Ochotona curzoniae TaxID=130825 RepID=UPI001B352A5C|nr:ZBED6 C-terminal-like protein [Ochotona curzoniae]
MQAWAHLISPKVPSMLELEKVKKPPKRPPPSESMGQEPHVCASSPVAKSPSATLACPGPKFITTAVNTHPGHGHAAGEDLPGAEIKPEIVEAEGKGAGDHRKKLRPSGSPKEHESDLSLSRSTPHPLPSGMLDPEPDLAQVLLERKVEGTLGLPAYTRKKKACTPGRPGLHPAASQTKCRGSPAQRKPRRDSGSKADPGQEPLVLPKKKKVSRQKARVWKEEKGQSRKKSRSLPPSVEQALSPSAGIPVLSQPPQVASPERLELSQEARQATVLPAQGTPEAQPPKKWKKKLLLAGMKEKLESQPSVRKSSCWKKLIRAVQAQTQAVSPAQHSLGLLQEAGPKPMLDVTEFFTVDRKNIHRLICSLCHSSVRQSRAEGQSQTSGLVHHLASKHGLRWERRSSASSQGNVPADAASPVSEGHPVPRCHPPTASWGGSSREPALDSAGQPFQAPPASPVPPVAVRDGQSGTYAPNQPRAQAWNHSVAELLCGLALPLSFVSSKPFRKFMAQVDPCYHLPSPAFFSNKALPLLHEAVGEQVLQEMQWAAGGRVHLTTSMLSHDSVVNYVAITAHWGTTGQGPVAASGSLRKQAVLWVRGMPLEKAVEEKQSELLEQISVWLGRSSLRPGFLVSGGCPSLELTVKAEGYTHIPCFAHHLNSLVSNFLCRHHSIQIILGTARAICSHFQGSAEARRLLVQLQQQCGLPAQQPLEALSDHWASAYRLMEWLVEQQQPLKQYEEKHQLGKDGTALSAMFWSLTTSLVQLLQPFQMVVQEASTPQASLSQVLPQLRYLYIFLDQAHRHFRGQSAGEVDVAIRLAEGLALQLSTDSQLNEFFYREEFVLATLLDPRFKGKMEAILPTGADIDHWRQVLVYKVKEIMVSEDSLPASGTLLGPRGTRVSTPMGMARSPREPLQSWGGSGSLLLGGRGKSLLEQLESAGLLASERSGASLATENHQASIIVKKYLRENETVGAQDDPLAYWEKKRRAWPALAQLATIYLSCPATGAFSEGIFASLNSPTMKEQESSLKTETIEHLLFLKANLENFPNYTPPPLVFPSGDLAKAEQNA